MDLHAFLSSDYTNSSAAGIDVNGDIVGTAYNSKIGQWEAILWRRIRPSDFNGDGKPDLFFQNYTTGQLALWRMNGVNAIGGSYVSQQQVVGWKVVAVADMNGDGKLDLVFQNSTSGQMQVWYLNGATVIGSASLSASATAGWTGVGPK